MKAAAAFAGIALMFLSACGSDAGDPPLDPEGALEAPGDTSGEGAGAKTSKSGGGDTTPTPAPYVPQGEPLPSTPDEKWTWVDVPGTKCANGSDTGIGVNITSKSDDVLVFLEGGGACWDGGTCYGGKSISTYLTGYNKVAFDTDPQRVLFATSRGRNNPFRDMNMIYVPYCTGDVHAGNNVVTYSYLGIKHETHHVGRKNLEIVLSRVAATFPSAKNVWVAGDSAGGFGAALSLPLAKQSFPEAQLGIIDDSGQPIAPAPGRWEAWRKAWKLEAPAGCSACETSPTAYIDFYAKAYPDVKLGLLSFRPDPIISVFMGISQKTFASELEATLATFDSMAQSNKHYFIASGASHVVFQRATPELGAWLQQAIDGSPGWSNAKP